MFSLFIFLEIKNVDKKKNALEILKYSTNTINLIHDCHSNYIFTENKHTNMIFYYELWNDETSLKRRIKSDQFKHILNVIDMSSKKPEILISNVIEDNGIEFIQSIRKKDEKK